MSLINKSVVYAIGNIGLNCYTKCLDPPVHERLTKSTAKVTNYILNDNELNKFCELFLYFPKSQKSLGVVIPTNFTMQGKRVDPITLAEREGLVKPNIKQTCQLLEPENV